MRPNDYYPATSGDTSHTYLSQSDKDYSQQRNDSYLAPTTQQRTIAGNLSDEMIPLVKQNDKISSTNIPQVGIKSRAPPPPPKKRDNSGDSYV